MANALTKINTSRKTTIIQHGKLDLVGSKSNIDAEFVARVADSLEAGGLPRYPESLFVEINVMKS